VNRVGEGNGKHPIQALFPMAGLEKDQRDLILSNKSIINVNVSTFQQPVMRRNDIVYTYRVKEFLVCYTVYANIFTAKIFGSQALKVSFRRE
jgi:hypothetical protein